MSMQGSCGKVAVDIQKFIITHFLAIVFLLALVLALSWPAPGIAINEVTVLNGVRIVQEVFIGVVFFISGLGLDTQALKRLGVRRMWGAFAYSIVGEDSVGPQFHILALKHLSPPRCPAMLLVTPLIGFAYVKLPMTPIEFDYGLCIWVAMPTTLGVGVALVRSCGGNDSLGTIITVVSNVLAIFIVPPMLKFLFLGLDQGSGSLQFSINIDIPDLLLKLSITILAPAVVGKVLRDYWKQVELFAVKYKTHLSLFSSSLLAGIIYFNISSARDSLLQTPGGMIASLIALVSATYLFFQALNLLLVHYVSMPSTYYSCYTY